MESGATPKLDRLDRHVKRSYLRISDKMSRHRVACSLEEALRLLNLPGEEEGRIYCFRSVSLSGIPAEANRKIWMDRVQQVLSALAARAVHGTDPGAGAADAVYFHHVEEALETLLRRALQSKARPEWFSASILGLAPGQGPATQIPVILEHLRRPSIPQGVAAAIIVAAVGVSDPAPLLAAIPVFTIRDWLRELDGRKTLFADGGPILLPDPIRTAVRQAADHFGWRDPRTTWLAALAVVSLSPGALAAGTAVQRAHLILRRLEAGQPENLSRRGDLPARSDVRSSGNTSQPLIFDHDDTAQLFSPTLGFTARVPQSDRQDNAPLANMSFEERALGPTLVGKPTQVPGSQINAGLINSPRNVSDSSPDLGEGTPVAPSIAEPSDVRAGDSTRDAGWPFADRQVLSADQSTAPLAQSAPIVKPTTGASQNDIASAGLLGESSQAAGLYFLLNVLCRLQIPAALEACPALTEAGFVAHLLKRVAARAGVAQGDPILLCLRPGETAFSLSPEVLAILRSGTSSKIWPPNFPPPHRTDFENVHFLAIWALAVRRWCWRTGRITVREIVNRQGRVWLTRTDLDVTLPLSAIDIRIRRIGLDIDPGWLPWFGEFGRVVRFHYRDREPGSSRC
jgi:hypothetical protein